MRLLFFCKNYVYSSVGDAEVSVSPWAFFFFFPHLCSSLPFFEIILKLNSFERDVLAADNYPLCGLHYTQGFSCEKYGGSKKRVGARTGNSRTPMDHGVTLLSSNLSYYL